LARVVLVCLIVQVWVMGDIELLYSMHQAVPPEGWVIVQL